MKKIPARKLMTVLTAAVLLFCPALSMASSTRPVSLGPTEKPNWQPNPTAAPVYNEYTESNDGYYRLNSKLATRTGPGTNYDEPGSFFLSDYAGTSLRVLSRSYQSVWWVQVEFSHRGRMMRAYTGAKRFDNLDLNRIPEETALWSGTVNSTLYGLYGPGTEYETMPYQVQANTPCTVFQEERGYLLIEFRNNRGDSTMSRAWVPSGAVSEYGSSGTPVSAADYVYAGQSWWDEEPEWSYLEISNVTGRSADVYIFFYRIAYIDGQIVFDDPNDRNHGHFSGRIDYNDSLRIQGEAWFGPDGVSIRMNAHDVAETIEDRPVYVFLYR